MADARQGAEEQVRKVVEALIREYRPEKIILFGSRAWGDAREDSDIDLCVVKEDTKDPLDMMKECYSAAWGKTTLGVDFVVYTPRRLAERLRMGDPFVRKIHTSGKTLYDAERR